MVLHAIVVSEPRGLYKGRWRFTLTSEGAVLERRNNTLEIPVGTPVRFLGNSKLEVTLPDCRLELGMSKLGFYTNRYVRDVAAFLAGQGNRPELTAYRLPWYFHLLSWLPIGIPIVTFGGAIFGAIGGGLVAVCYTIAGKEDWPSPVRLLIISLLVAAGYGVLVTLLIAAHVARMQ